MEGKPMTTEQAGYRNVELKKRCLWGRPGDKVVLSEKVATRCVRDGLAKDLGEYEIETPIRIERADGTVEKPAPGEEVDGDDDGEKSKGGPGSSTPDPKNKANPETKTK
jgi:hypothetical protein